MKSSYKIHAAYTSFLPSVEIAHCLLSFSTPNSFDQQKAMGFHGETHEEMNCQITPPVSPTGHVFNTAEFSPCVHVICEFDQPVDVSHFKQAIVDMLLPNNPRFSCIMVS